MRTDKKIFRELKKEIRNINDNNRAKIMILLRMVSDINKSKGKISFNYCKTVDEAIQSWKRTQKELMEFDCALRYGI